MDRDVDKLYDILKIKPDKNKVLIHNVIVKFFVLIFIFIERTLFNIRRCTVPNFSTSEFCGSVLGFGKRNVQSITR